MDTLTSLALEACHDEEARSRFVELSYASVWRLCAGLVDAGSADDLAQLVFVRALRALGGFRGDASARTWLLTIARRTCIDEIRSRQRRRRVAARLAAIRHDAVAGGSAPEAGEACTVADLVGRLEEDRRTAFVLTQLLGLSYEEAGAVCGCPIGTIRSRVARARGDLLHLLEEAELPDAGRQPRSGSPA